MSQERAREYVSKLSKWLDVPEEPTARDGQTNRIEAKQYLQDRGYELNVLAHWYPILADYATEAVRVREKEIVANLQRVYSTSITAEEFRDRMQTLIALYDKQLRGGQE